MTDVAIFQILLTLAKLHSGLSNSHESRDKVDDVINCDLLSRANAGVSFNFIPYVELELKWEKERYNMRHITERQTKWRVKGWSLEKGWSFTISVFMFFHSFIMPYRLIPLISALEEFPSFVNVGPSALFGPALNSPKIDSFRWYLINLLSRVPKVSKTV